MRQNTQKKLFLIPIVIEQEYISLKHQRTK